MVPNRSRQLVIVVVCAVWRGAKRVRAVMRPPVQSVGAFVVRVSGCAGTGAELVVGHVALAALGAGALALAGAVMGTGPSQLLKLAGVLGVSAIALHAVFVVVRRYQGSSPRLPMRAVLVSALARIPASQGRVPAARALAAVCEPRRFWAELGLPSGATEYALRVVISRLALPHAKSAIPGLGQALDMLDAYEASLDSARFVRELALAASDLQRHALAA